MQTIKIVTVGRIPKTWAGRARNTGLSPFDNFCEAHTAGIPLLEHNGNGVLVSESHWWPKCHACHTARAPRTVETCEPRRQILYYGRTTSVLQSDEFGLNLPRRRILYYGRTASVLRSGEFGLNLPQRLILHCGRTTSVLQSADFGLGVRCCTAGVVLLHYRATSSVSTCLGFAVAGMRPWLVGTLAPGRTVVGGCLVPGGLRPGWLRPWQRGDHHPAGLNSCAGGAWEAPSYEILCFKTNADQPYAPSANRDAAPRSWAPSSPSGCALRAPTLH